MKHIINTILTLAVCSFMSVNANAQLKIFLRQTISTSGGSFITNMNEKSVLIQQSIGQASNLGTFSNNKTVVHQGFIQPRNPDFEVKLENNSFKSTCFPNPFNDVLHIELEELFQGNIDLQLVDLTGRNINNTIHSPAKKLTVNYSEIESGFYLLIIQIGNISTTTKIQKQ